MSGVQIGQELFANINQTSDMLIQLNIAASDCNKAVQNFTASQEENTSLLVEITVGVRKITTALNNLLED